MPDTPERPKSTLRAGLDKRERERLGLKTPRLAHLKGKRTRLSDLKLHQHSITKTVARLHTLREATHLALAKQEAAIRERWAQTGFVEGEPTRFGKVMIDELTDARRIPRMERDLVKMRKEVAALAEKEVGASLADLRASKEALKEARLDWDHCVSVLMVETLTTRAEHAEALQNSGAHELDRYSRRAIQEGDMALAGAIVSRIDRIGKQKDSLLISKTDLAEAMVSEIFNEAVSLLAIGELNILLGEQEGREALAQSLNAGDSTALGLKKASVQQEIGRELTDADFTHQPVTGRPTEKKPEKKPEEKNSDDREQEVKDFARFYELYAIEKLSDEQAEELLGLGKSTGLYPPGDGS